MGQSFSEQQIQHLVSTVDDNNDGKLDFEGLLSFQFIFAISEYINKTNNFNSFQ